MGDTMIASTDWPQTILLIAGIIVALGVIWQKGIHPVARGITKFEASVPVVVELVDQLHDTPDFGKILKEIIAQFRSDSGTTLKDAMNRLEGSVARLEANQATQESAYKVLTTNVESARILAEQDRATHARLADVVDRLAASLNISVAKLEAGQVTAAQDRAKIASNLDDHHEHSREGHAAIAADLEATHARAEASDSTDAGAAADAAMRRPDDEAG